MDIIHNLHCSLCLYVWLQFPCLSDDSGWLLAHAHGLRWNAVAQPRFLQCISLFSSGYTPQCLPPQWSLTFCTVLLATSNMTSGFRVSFFLHLISFSQWASWGYNTVSFLWGCTPSLKKDRLRVQQGQLCPELTSVTTGHWDYSLQVESRHWGCRLVLSSVMVW